jgi:hypothetical protein
MNRRPIEDFNYLSVGGEQYYFFDEAEGRIDYAKYPGPAFKCPYCHQAANEMDLILHVEFKHGNLLGFYSQVGSCHLFRHFAC